MAAAVASSAVAERIFTWEELLDISRQVPTQPWRLNSQALKYFRHMGEDPPGVLKGDSTVHTTVIRIGDMMRIGVMAHDGSGPGFTFDAPAVAGKTVEWCPAQFLTQLRPDAVATLGLQEHGVRQLICTPFDKVVDKMRLIAAQQAGQPFGDGVLPPLWDFVLTRGDGVFFALHPSWKGFKCKIAQFNDAVQARCAAAGYGGVRAWEREAYPIRGHGLYQEGQDPVRDEKRKLNLEAKSNKAHGKSSPAVAGQSYVGGGPACVVPPIPQPTTVPQVIPPQVIPAPPGIPPPQVIPPQQPSSSSAAPAASSSSPSAVAEPSPPGWRSGESFYRGWRVWHNDTEGRWMYWTGSDWAWW